MAELGMEGLFMITAPAPDAPRVEPAPENTPVGVTRLTPPPGAAPPFGLWMHVLDDRGASHPAILLREEGGLLVVDPSAMEEAIDPGSLHAALDQADREWARIGEVEREWPSSLPALDSEARRYSLEPAPGGQPRGRVRGTSKTHGFSRRMIRAEEVVGGVLRQRWVE